MAPSKAARNADEDVSRRSDDGLVALSGCTIARPSFFDGKIEIVTATAEARGFPTRVSEGLGICLKLGKAHRVQSDGRSLTYPADAVCVRYPGCVWSSEVAEVGFVSIEIAQALLPRGIARSPMRFLRAAELPDVRPLAACLETAESPLARQEALARLFAALHARSVLSAAELEADAPYAAALRKAREFLASTMSRNASLDELAAATQVNKFVLIRYFRKKLGTTPHGYLLSLRVERASAMLAQGKSPAEVAVEVGFADQGHFSRYFKRIVGLSPGQYARSVRTTGVVRAGQFRSRLSGDTDA